MTTDQSARVRPKCRGGEFYVDKDNIERWESVEEAETGLREKYGSSFDRSGNKQFASGIEEAVIKEIVYAYPKHSVTDGVQMLDGLLSDNHDMPMHKEYLTARLVAELFNEELILLPRYMDRMLNRVAGYFRFDNYSLSDGISAVSEDGKTYEFKYVKSLNKAIRNLNTAVGKADVGVVVVSEPISLRRLNLSRFSNNGEAYIVNVYDENNIEVLEKTTPTQEWRLGHQDSKSQHRLDNSSPVTSIASELKKVNPEDQTKMDYAVYLNSAEGQNKADLDFLLPQSRLKTDEYYETEVKYKGTDKWMKAPNGRPTNLTERQWIQVRTPGFVELFGDWMRSSRIRKLLESETIMLNWNKEKPPYLLEPSSAKKYLQSEFQGVSFENDDTGQKYVLGKRGRQKLLSHSRYNEAHLKALFFLPEIIKKSIFITESDAYKENAQYARYRYFVCGIKLDGVDYTVKSVFGLDSYGDWVYDQGLSEIEKGTLIGMLNKHVTQNSLQLKDTTLISILQDDCSKLLDENGEPNL